MADGSAKGLALEGTDVGAPLHFKNPGCGEDDAEIVGVAKEGIRASLADIRDERGELAFKYPEFTAYLSALLRRQRANPRSDEDRVGIAVDVYARLDEGTPRTPSGYQWINHQIGVWAAR